MMRIPTLLTFLMVLLLEGASTEAFITSPLPSNRLRLSPLSLKCLAETDENLPSVNHTRKHFLSATFAVSILSTMIVSQPAKAAYGDSSSIELPNYIEFLIEKNSMEDPSKLLYKGADIEVQIKRISNASERLSEIPIIAKQKKWSQVQGILTGPLGTLVQTMNALCKETDSGDAKKAASKVKADILLISQEASRKNDIGVVKACEEAQRDLETFAKLVF